MAGISSRQLDIVYGEIERRDAISALIAELEGLQTHGTLYVGYPVLSSGDARIFVDALLVSENHGVIAFDVTSMVQRRGNTIINDAELRDKQDQIYALLYNKLNSQKDLRKGRRLGVDISVITYHPNAPDIIWNDETAIVPQGRLRAVADKLSGIDHIYIRPLNAAIQRISTLRPVKRREKVTSSSSKGGKLRYIEKEIANLDHWQKQAAIESVDGPQRIRGLAGSGKTIVLALKAAYLHARHPDWNIVVTFNTLSLYQQFRDLITRFCYDQTDTEPDWTKVQVIHAWGGRGRQGVYSTACAIYGIDSIDFATAAERHSRSTAFDGACTEFLESKKGRLIAPPFDVILMDEAQDLPASFFHIAYELVKEPKRIIWAYDDLQNLGDYEMPSTDKLFGFDSDGQPRVRIQNRPGEPRQDIVLPVCYRNTPWALASAHALGFGVYRAEGLVQMFDDPSLWTRIGYELESGRLELGHRTRLRRRADSFPSYFTDLLSPEDAVHLRVYETEMQQYGAAAEQIKNDIDNDEVEHNDILVVLPDIKTSRSKGALLIRALNSVKISAHLVGVTSSRDEMFQKNSVAVTHIFRAKGNEAPIVYVLNAEYCYGGFELAKKRNSLFTAMTRSRAWLRVFGVGDEMQKLADEFKQIQQHQYELDFHYPTAEEIKRLSKVHRERTDEELQDIERQVEAATELFRKLKAGELSIDALPEELREMVRTAS